jgi:hypothetical protein
LALLICSCAPLDPLDPNVCGNGVVEPGEDCDRFVDHKLGQDLSCAVKGDVHQCHYICVNGFGSPRCPTGWSCGRDNLCRFASGNFAEPAISPLAIPNDGFALGDVDGDAYTDLVSRWGGTISARFGGATMGFAERLDLSIEGQSGDLVVRDVDGDQRADMLVPTRIGLVMNRGERDHPFIPSAFPAFDLRELGQSARFVPLRTRARSPGQRLLYVASAAGSLSMSFDRATKHIFDRLPDSDVAHLAGAIPVGDVDADGNDDLVLAFAGAQQALVFVSDGERILDTPIAIVPLPFAIDRGAILADVDGDRALDLLVSLQAGRVAIAKGDGRGGFALPAIDPRFEALNPTWPLAAADLDGDGRADFVDGRCIYTTASSSVGGALARTCPPGLDPFSEVAIADFNHDGLPDAAVSFVDRSGIAFMLGPSFDVHFEETGSPASTLEVADFDGDRIADLVFTERVPASHGRSAVGVLVSYGAALSVPSNPLLMEIEEAITGLAAGEIGAHDLLGEVVYAGSRRDGSEPVVVLTGTHDHQLLAPLQLARTATAEADVVRAVFAGRFAKTEGALDALVISSGPVSGDPAWWVLTGTSAEPSFSLARSTLVTSLPPLCGPSAFGDLDADGLEEIVTIDQCASPHTLRICNALQAGCSTSTLSAEAGAAAHIALADLDADGNTDVLLGFDPAAIPSSTTALQAIVLWGMGSASRIGAEGRVRVSGDARPLSVVALNANADSRLELALFTDRGVFIAAQREPRIYDAPSTPVIAVQAVQGEIRAADLDADGLPDLVYSDGFNVHWAFAVPNHGLMP